MPDHHTIVSTPERSLPPSPRYAIPAARAVVHALIARDRDAAEAAALRTCRDCDLLIRLIQEVAPVLHALAHGRVSLSPGGAAALARRAEQALALIMAAVPHERESPKGRIGRKRRKRHDGGPDTTPGPDQLARSSVLTSPKAPPRRTVAALGLRARLVPEVKESEAAAPIADEPNCNAGPKPGGPPSATRRR